MNQSNDRIQIDEEIVKEVSGMKNVKRKTHFIEGRILYKNSLIKSFF